MIEALSLSDDGRVIGGAQTFGLDSAAVLWIDREPFYLRDYLRSRRAAGVRWVDQHRVRDRRVARWTCRCRFRRRANRFSGIHRDSSEGTISDQYRRRQLISTVVCSAQSLLTVGTLSSRAASGYAHRISIWRLIAISSHRCSS